MGRPVVDVTPTQLSSDSALDIMEHLRDGEEWQGRSSCSDATAPRFSPTYATYRFSASEKTVIGIVGLSRRLLG